ncbi:hypothetical protein AB0C81_28955 [Streptomyces roseoverticillatus]|uniref:hypothetical protein n=1 Tax=Streptomyces roseoverticillatus TaxID=66429 RepID=UPI0034023BBF
MNAVPLRHRLPRLRTLVIPLLGAYTTLMVLAGAAHAQDIDPAGIGALLPSPDKSVGKGEGTMYETWTNPLMWHLDTDYGSFDVLDPAVEIIPQICMALTAAVGAAVAVLIQWLFQTITIPELEKPLTAAISGASKGLTATLLPAALAVGGLIAFMKHKGAHGSGLNQIGWVFTSGLLAVSLLVSPGTWVSTVDTGRQLGTNIAMNATANGLGEGNQDFPFDMGHKPKYGSDEKKTTIRKATDAFWRSYVAGPWCVAQFGSLEACEKHGKNILDEGISKDKRSAYIKNKVTKIGADSRGWAQGHNPIGQTMVVVPALISVIVFGAVVVMLAFTSLASLLGALMLLVAGVLFACMWVIPGRPRQWGIRWFDQLVGFTLQSCIATLVLGCTLIVNTVVTSLIPTIGWLPSAGLSIAAALVALRFRRLLDSIVGISGGMGAGGAIMGLLAAKGASKAAKFIGRRFKRRRRRTTREERSGGGSDEDIDTSDEPSPRLPGGGTGPLRTGVPRRPVPPPLPSHRIRRPLPPEGPERSGAAVALTSDPDHGLSVTLSRSRSGADKSVTSSVTIAPAPAPAHPPIDAGTRRPRPELPPGAESEGSSGAALGTAGQRSVPQLTVSDTQDTPAPPPLHTPIALPPGRPSPLLRPEVDDVAPRFAFRSPPRPGEPTPKIIQHKVIKSVTHRPPRRPAALARPAGHTRPAPKATRKGAAR